jgi:PKD repeat protein
MDMRPVTRIACLLVLTLVAGGLGFADRFAAICQAATTDPLQVSADPHWLEFRGQKVLLIGDSVTQGWMELGTNFNQAAYVDALDSRGINVLMIWTYIGISNQIADLRIGYDAPEIWPWAKNGSTFDLTQLNSAYFDRLRSLVQLADSRDITVLITIHDGWTKTRFDGHPFNQAVGGPLSVNSQYVELHDYNAEMPTTYNSAWTRQQKHQFFLERFCDRIIQATADQPNVMYEMFNEGEWYDQTNLRAFQVHFLNFFKARTPRVTMVNDDHIGGADFRGEVNCDVISWHRPNWSSTTSAAEGFNYYVPAFAGSPVKPFFFSEPVPEYQGDSSLHDAIMRLMWGTALAGAGFVVQNDASFGFDPNASMAAEAADRDIVLDREGHCARFFGASGVEFWTMVPNGSLSSTGVCLAEPGREYIVYSQSGSAFTLNMSAGTGTFNCRFYNPRSGQFGTSFQRSGGATESFTKPDSGDWVLHVVVVLNAPVAVIGANPMSGRSPLLVSFDGSASFDTDGGTIVSYAWDFEDDGTTDATGPTADHLYVGKQTAVARLTVTDNDGRTGTTTVSISVATFPGDFDGDGDVDQKDFGHFQECYSGSGEEQTNPNCLNAILDGDQDVDQADFAVFQACMSGPSVPASCDR